MGVSWSLSSDLDPRWDCDDYIEENLFISAGLPSQVQKKINTLKEKFGTEPVDLMYTCMKD